MKAIAAFAYLAAGGALLGSVGRSRLQWDDPPTIAKRVVTIAAWPVILAMVLAGAWDVTPADDQERAWDSSKLNTKGARRIARAR